jgi:hypothetical protein
MNMADPGIPTLLTPANEAVTIGNVLVFTFIVPTDTDNTGLVFRIELDKSNPPSSLNPNYKVNESRLALDKKSNGIWQVKNLGGTYIDMPTAGVLSDFYGRDARVIIRKQDTLNYPDSLGSWFWRISASDNITCSKFNVAVFGQRMFCAG